MNRIRRGGFRIAVAVAAVLAPAAQARALLDDRLELFASESVTHDDNVFRLSPDADPATEIGSPFRGDTYRTHSFGLNLELPVSHQRVVAGIRLDQHRYERFDVLDLDGHRGHVAWHWQAGSRLQGRLGYAESLDLASLANVQSGIDSSTPNFLETKERLFDATWSLSPRLDLRGKFHAQEHDNSADEFLASDARIDHARIELGCASAAGNRIGISLHRSDGSLPNPQLIAGVPVNNDYRHEAVEVFVEWSPGARSKLTAGAGTLRREFREVPERDFDDWSYRAAFDWLPADALQLGVSISKEVSTNEQVNVGFVLQEGIALTATWKPLAKLDVAVQLQRADREYLGDAAIALGLVPARSERFDMAGAKISYRPNPALTLDLGIRHERRDSAIESGDFKATVTGLAIRVAF